jgi:hypothetical protein
MRLLLVGAWPADVRAAMQAKELGADATLREAQQVVGTNLNSGPPVPPCPAPSMARDRSSGMNRPDAERPAEGRLIL